MCGRVAAAAVRVAADDLHERVGHVVGRADARARGDRRAHGAGGPQPERLQPGVAGAARTPSRSASAPRAGSSAAVSASQPADRRRVDRAGQPRVLAGPARAEARATASARAPPRAASASSRRFVGRRRGVPVAQAEDLDGRVVHARRLRRRGAREARRQRALVDDGDLRVAVGVGQRAFRELERLLGPLRRRRPRTSRKRAGAVPCDTRMTWPGSPLPQLSSPCTRHRPPASTRRPASPRSAA